SARVGALSCPSCSEVALRLRQAAARTAVSAVAKRSISAAVQDCIAGSRGRRRLGLRGRRQRLKQLVNRTRRDAEMAARGSPDTGDLAHCRPGPERAWAHRAAGPLRRLAHTKENV